ncbi:MAG: hypothetical protein K6B14_09595 [Lachnospiraceae bacterium]|nr:hypothetical protein [Lachnospiraceae bacterium]
MSDFKMDYNTKANLIGGLANAFSQETETDLKIDSSNYIENTGALETLKISDISLSDLRKVRGTIEEYQKKFANSKDINQVQLVAHLKIANMCVAEIIRQKNKTI